MAKSKSENKLDSNLDNIINEETNQINSNSIDISEELKKELELTNQKNKDLEDKINNITIMQGKMQKRLKIGNLIISTEQVNIVFKGIKNPHQIKELIKKEKASEYERRTLLRKIL